MDDRELRVLQFVKGLDIGGFHGGADLFGMNLACALKRQGIDARLCVFYQMDTPAEKQYLAQLAECGVECFFLHGWGGKTSLRSYAAGSLRLARYLKQEHIDVLHSHFHVGTFLAVELKVLGRVRRLARTTHVDREWLRGWNGPIQQMLIRAFIFVLFPLLVDIESGVSQTSVDVLNRRWLARLLGKKATVIYNSIQVPIKTDVQTTAQTAGPSKAAGRFVVGSVGRLTEQKGYAYLLEAVPEILRALPAAKFWIAGAGPLLDDLQAQARRLEIDQAVRFLGKRDDVPDLLDATDLFVLPSIYEGLPTVVLESIARGVPVVATDVPGTREIIQDGQTGWLVPARDPHALANGILNAAREPHRRAQLAVSALVALHQFSIETAAEKYALLYRSVR